MSKWDKLLARICGLSRDLRFDELRKVLESKPAVIALQVMRGNESIYILLR